MRASGFALSLLLVAACGRTPLLAMKAHDASPPIEDAGLGMDAARTADTAGDTLRPEGRPPQPDADPPTCSALASLASRGVLTPRHAKQVLFAKDRSSLVLRVAGTATGGDEVKVVRLPSGQTSDLSTGAIDINWIGDGSRVLVRDTLGDLVAFSLDGTSSATLARYTCEHLTSPDGGRVLAWGDCNSMLPTLSSIDTRTGSRTELGRTTYNAYGLERNVVFSPSGGWIAYLQPSPAVDGAISYGGTIHVVDSSNRSYALSSVPDASNPRFASDQVLLFTTPSTSRLAVDVRAHVLGSGDTSRVIARGVSFDSDLDNGVSPDGQWMLAAIMPLPDLRSSYALSAFSLDGREVALVGDLFPFWTTEALWHSFGFAADNRHVVYLTARPSLGTAVVERSGGLASPLSSNHYFVLPPTGNLVALTETRSTPMRVRVTNLDTIQDVAVAEVTATPADVTFTPDGASVVFVEPGLASSPARLQHLSGRTGAVTALAKWKVNQLSQLGTCCNRPGPGYPIDPTGCFTIVDSDLEGGTKLILLPE